MRVPIKRILPALIVLGGPGLSAIELQGQDDAVPADQPPDQPQARTQAVNHDETRTDRMSAMASLPESPDAGTMRQVILSRNIFEPARKAPPATIRSPGEPPAEVGPQPLKRPFRVIGIRAVEGEIFADLLFEDPRENRTIEIGDVIETIKVIQIKPAALICRYAGSPVRIAVGETSDTALKRLLGTDTTSEYYLMGTTVLKEEAYAQFYFPRDGRYVQVSIGDMLGGYRVVEIEPGRVFVEDSYGFQIPIEPITPPKP